MNHIKWIFHGMGSNNFGKEKENLRVLRSLYVGYLKNCFDLDVKINGSNK